MELGIVHILSQQPRGRESIWYNLTKAGMKGGGGGGGQGDKVNKLRQHVSEFDFRYHHKLDV